MSHPFPRKLTTRTAIQTYGFDTPQEETELFDKLYTQCYIYIYKTYTPDEFTSIGCVWKSTNAPCPGTTMTNASPIYNLKAVMHETGLTSSTLHAWERRYGLVNPQRSPGGHRLYSRQDIELLKWLVARQAEGLSISAAVEMWRNLENGRSNPDQQIPGPRAVIHGEAANWDGLRDEWMAACLIFDEPAAEQVLSQAFAMTAPEMACNEVLLKGLAELGVRWSHGSVSVQQEHFASALAMRRVGALYAAAPRPTRPGRILAACPPGEQHDFALLLIAFLLRRRGWDVVYLGANVPLSQLDATLKLTSSSLFVSLAQTLSSAAALRELAAHITAYSVPLAYGGGIFNALPALTARISGFFLGGEIVGVPHVVEGLMSGLPTLPTPQPVSSEYAQMSARFVAKEALVASAVTAALTNAPGDWAHLESAHRHFAQSIRSALALGDIQFLDPLLPWLESLPEAQRPVTSPDKAYFNAYRQAVERYLGQDGGIILDWLNRSGLPG
jgi:MerR family transcriptional regulator, light-induced transcriptional regulator